MGYKGILSKFLILVQVDISISFLYYSQVAGNFMHKPIQGSRISDRSLSIHTALTCISSYYFFPIHNIFLYVPKLKAG